MNEIERKYRNDSRLQEMQPAFRVRVQAVLKEMESYGYRPRIQEAWRSLEKQMEAYREGRSKVKYGFHNVSGTNGVKEALATDIYDDDYPEEPRRDYLLHLAAAAGNNGLTTGIRWDLSPDRTAAIDAAIASKNWNVKIAMGWDSQHVEVTGMTIADALAGKRPEMPPTAAGTPPVSAGTVNPPDVSPAVPGGTPPASGGTVNPPSDNQFKAIISHYKVVNTETNQAVEYDLSTAFKPVNLLPVPYASQIGPGADAHRNDCGAASTVMLMRAYLGLQMTPDDFYTKFSIPGDVFLSVSALRNAMGSQGLLTDFRAGLTLQDLFTFLAAGRPPIVLFSYGTLSRARLTERTFEGPHFAVVVGMDCKYIYLHDPLYTDPAVGEAHPYPLDIFWRAWKDVALDSNTPNPERSAIIPIVGIGLRIVRRVRVTADGLYVRTAPNPDTKIVATLHKDDIVEVQRELGGWGEVGTNRWINMTFTVSV
jgi:hypothetical protein